ncbi:branched-chain amino acid transport system II carrier protein [Asaccharospora irregularis]|uniref:Branched-chain amino acid transport system carrier protein n=1 Tax=Asaccharospora irregularis DSM 2635 TaxID=1121321 RepID=A0A1M5K479_9FIRM|nr:branched-chain amino acid transport system II carrier protein [Asaccharospora irregularis]SHG47279.1 branched-chain amino acid:cation transporter, LIVCS family [Asaccharospora irregularis DSM 2635]
MGKKMKDTVVVGFALFAMFFGAGNLIFPPYLGVISGQNWLTSFSGFVLADVGLALLAILAATKFNGDVNKMFSRAGNKLNIILGSAIVICIGPLLAIPRTAATTFEMGIQPIFGNFNTIIFSIIFFAVTLVLTIKPSKVVDIVGSFLTPALLVALAILIIKGIMSPLGNINPQPAIDNLFSEGVAQGYQTMDTLGAVVFATVIILSITNKGYTTEKEKVSMSLKSGLVAAVGLCLVYGGLCYLGATVSEMYGKDVNQTALIVSITEGLLGSTGKVILALIVSLACLTTSIGLTSAAGQYFSGLTKGKLKYEHIVIGICVFSAVVSNLGVSNIIKYSAPILSMVYPATVTLIILALFGEKISNDNVFKAATYMALFISILTVIDSMSVKIPAIHLLPLDSLGFNWIVPVLIAGIIGNFIPSGSKEALEYSKKLG